MPNSSSSATLVRPVSLSTISGALLNAHPGRRNICDCDMDDCNGHCADYTCTPRAALAATIAPSLGDDKSKGDDGDKDGPFQDIVASGPDDSTVIPGVLSRAQWIRWSHGLPLDTTEDINPIGTIEAQLLRATHGGDE